ncbi:MAG: transposase [Bacteroidota bacterium]
MVFLGDDAGQFNILTHALCWIHVERNLQKIHTYTPSQRQALDQLLTAFWKLYQPLKSYSKHPHPTPESASKPILITSATGKPNGSP